MCGGDVRGGEVGLVWTESAWSPPTCKEVGRVLTNMAGGGAGVGRGRTRGLGSAFRASPSRSPNWRALLRKDQKLPGCTARSREGLQAMKVGAIKNNARTREADQECLQLLAIRFRKLWN